MTCGLRIWLWVWMLGCVPGFAALGQADEVVARGKGFEVRRDEWEQLVIEQKVLFETRGQEVSAEQEARMEALTLDRLITRRLLALRATEADRMRAQELVKQGIADHQARLGSAEAYRRQVQASGTSVEVFEARLLEQAVADQVVLRELGSKVEVTEEQVRAYYDRGVDVPGRDLEAVVKRLEVSDRESTFYQDATNRLELIRQANLARLQRPAEAKARILVLFTKDPVTGKVASDSERDAKRARMGTLRQRALEGGDLGLVAAEHSEEPGAKANRGEYTAREKDLLPALRRPVFEGALQEISEVIETELGYYVVQVLDRRGAGKVPFEEASSGIRAVLNQQEVEKRMPGWVAALKQESGVEVLTK